MPRIHLLLATCGLLAACAESPTAPAAVEQSPSTIATAREPGTLVRCTASGTALSGYSVTVEWKRVRVLNVSVITENGTITTSLSRLRRNGSVTFTPDSEPLGFRLDDGQETLAQGGCSAA